MHVLIYMMKIKKSDLNFEIEPGIYPLYDIVRKISKHMERSD